MDGQDWNPVIVRSSKKPAGGAGSASSRGGITEAAARIRRLETEEFPTPTKHLSPESRTEMIRARTAKGMTQDQLNTACSFPHGTINKIENCKYCPTPVQMNAIKRVLGIVMKYA